MTTFLLNSRVSRSISFTLLLIFVSEIIFPTAAMALTSGPSQPEVQSFEPISTSDMVDVFSGDFKYNIPLMDVEGYPINIAYASGISTDQEATWVGLGWNLNVGNINRAMRGIPDDFKGDIIKKEMNMKPNRTYGINAGVDFEIFGKEATKAPGLKKGKKFTLKPSVGVGINYNNYTGFGVDLSIGVGISAGIGGKGKLDAGLGLHSNAASGLDITPNLSYSNRTEKKDKVDESLSNVSTASGALSGAFNTRAGLKQLQFNGGFTKSVEKTTLGIYYNPISAIPGIPTIKITENVSTIASKGRSAGGSVNFGLQSYVPSISMPMINNSAALNIKFSAHIFGIDADVRLGGFFSSQILAEKSKNVAAYGYMYSEYGANNSDAMLDFNREKDASFSRTTKNLPLTNFTYDVYNATGQGIGGTFRPFRSDIGHVFDPSGYSISDSYSLGAELGGGNLLKGGVDVSVIDVTSTSGKWTDNNDALSYFQFNAAADNNAFEPYYFKQVGEMTAGPSINGASGSLYTDLQSDEAYGIRIQQGSNNNAALNSNMPNIKATKNIEKANYDNSVNITLVNGQNKLSARQKRNQCFNTLNKDEAAKFGLQKDLYNGTGVKDFKANAGSEMRIMTGSPSHHIAEINVINTDGSRYYYGLPCYNIKSKEYSFNAAGRAYDNTTGLTSYDDADATSGNSNGIDNHYSMTENPAYAYSYLLTAVVSADYVDVNNNGPDKEDIGSFTKFHYKKSLSLAGSDYKWRMPIAASANKANFSENSKSNTQDNSANFSYGEKELWYLDEIETKNYIARFTLSDRKDGFGVADEKGTLSWANTPSKKIDKIDLYAKVEYNANAATAIPIKTVYFKYEYSLCKVLPNNSNQAATGSELSNGGGKLTLKQVYFTYGKSSRALFNKYIFTYSASNPNYHNKAYDRWGNYKPVTTPIDYSRSQINLTNSEFPYVEQNKANVDAYASSWALTKINLPSGGEINVEYESDDYAFVQNVPVGQMFKVLGVTATQPIFSSGNGLTDLYPATGSTPNSYLIIDLLNSTDAITDDQFKERYLKDISENNKQLFFKFLVNLTKSSSPPPAPTTPDFYEYVSGYADIEMVGGKPNGGLILNGSTPTGKAWIKLKDVALKNKGGAPFTNPIAMSAMQFARINYGNVVWDTPFNPPGDAEEALKQLAQAAKASLKTMITGFKSPNKALSDKDYCKQFVPNKSMVRLYNPTGKRLGGGSRVKRLYINDNWSTMTAVTPNPGQFNSAYGQSYTYEDKDENGRVISSGVASYEPMIGAEENSMKQPSYMGKNKWAVLAPDDRYYVEGPFGESFFPSANVGYSKVRVSNIVPANATNSSKTGFKIYEFYTAKDYPTICKHTPIMPKQFRSPLKTLVKIASRDLVSASQGYVVITNDMHGKPKAEFSFAEGKIDGKDLAETETRFFYKTKGGDYKQPSQVGLYSDASYSGNQLDNNCQTITKDGVVAPKNIGIDFDAIADFRESETQTNMISSQMNAASFIVGLIPILAPTVWPSVQFELSRFRSSVLTKVINQYGILEKTVVRQDKSVVTAQSVAFDAETGNVLISKTTNDFEDPIYTVKYPAHWGYDLMSGAYKSVGITFAGNNTGNGNYNVTSNTLLNIGDELALTLTSGSTSQRVWVASKTAANTVGLIDQLGNPVTYTPVKLKLIRPARRNLVTNEMAVLTCLKNPVVNVSGTNKLVITASSQVLDAKGTKFTDNWQIPLGLSNVGGCSCAITTLGNNVIGLLQNLFNCNTGANLGTPGPVNQFFNGVATTPVSFPFPTGSPPGYGIQTNSTKLWRDASMTVPSTCPNVGNPMCSITGGVFNFAFTSTILNQIPNPSPCASGSYQYAVWNGPQQAGGVNNMFTGDKIIGYVNTCSSVGYIGLDFASSTFGSTQKTQFYNDVATLRNGVTFTTSVGNSIYVVPAATQTDCNQNTLNVVIEFRNQSNVVVSSYPAKIFSSFLNNGLLINNCQSPNGPVSYVCGNLPGYKVNPFAVGIKGNWRPQINYTYLTDRIQSITTQANGLNTQVRSDGYYSSFADLYSNPNATGVYNDWTMPAPSTTVNKWVFTVQSSKYNQYGVEVETKDALGRYSSAIYGYNEALPIATAANAQLREIAYDGFEDYDYYNTTCNREPHFAFRSAVLLNTAQISNLQSHTGVRSLSLSNGVTATVSKQVSATQQGANSNTNYSSYVIADPDFIYPFYPVSANASGYNYLVSYWVKEAGTGINQAWDYTNNNLTITQGTGPAFATANLKKSTVIDGWQRVEYSFAIPAGYSGPLNVNLINSSSNANLKVFFDDIRIQPTTASMKTYVYNPTNMRYMAELDANNYATFYDYDDQGNLTRVKKETERGIMTIKESKTHYAN
jgi:hypothetical protein